MMCEGCVFESNLKPLKSITTGLGGDRRGGSMECDGWRVMGSVLDGEDFSFEGILIWEADLRNVDR